MNHNNNNTFECCREIDQTIPVQNSVSMNDYNIIYSKLTDIANEIKTIQNILNNHLCQDQIFLQPSPFASTLCTKSFNKDNLCNNMNTRQFWF